MTKGEFFQGEQYLIECACKYFQSRYRRPKTNQQIDPKLNWQPSLFLKKNSYEIIAAEVSNTTTYPEILKLRYADILNFNMLIAVYSVCTEEVYLNRSNQKDIKDLRSHGFGLLTIDSEGNIDIKFKCIPLGQHIPEITLKDEIKGLPQSIKITIKDHYEAYQSDAQAGLKSITELFEEIVKKGGRKIANKGWITNKNLNDSVADLLDEMFKSDECEQARKAIGGARSYYGEYRNLAHHPPKDKQAAYKKITKCKHGFLEGIDQIKNFRSAFKNININI